MNELPLLFRILLARQTLYIFACSLAIGCGIGRLTNSLYSFQDHRPVGDPERRVDGNAGHRSIDFGGQWLMGRMLVTGHGRELFSRPRQWEVTQQAYPPDRESPNSEQHDPELLIQHFMGTEDPRWRDFAGSTAALIGSSNPFQQAAVAMQARPDWSEQRLHELTHPQKEIGIGGPLYPPIHAFVMAPFATGDHPQAAYFSMQIVQTLLCYLAGLGVTRLSNGRIWWPLASSLILLYPGCRGVVDLGQNSALSLNLLIWGWVAMARGRLTLGGIVWGLLAYKPVWAVSFILLLLLLRQWRAALAMAYTGIALILATLPFVGLHTWLHWLSIGQMATRTYNIDENWITLSRDLLGIPRRFLTDFSLPRAERDSLLAMFAGWALWLIVVEITLRVFCLRTRREVPFTGPLPAMLILTTWMCTYHFMYYDALLSSFGVCVLLADPRPFFRIRSAVASDASGRRSIWMTNSFVLTVIAAMLLHENVTQPIKIEATAEVLSYTKEKTHPDGRKEHVPIHLMFGTSDRYAIDTLLVLVLWTWCWIVVLGGAWKVNEEKRTG